MDFMEISRKRKTVRRFFQMPVEQEKVEKILEAGRWSPTAVNLQPQRILVLNTPESLAKVGDLISFLDEQTEAVTEYSEPLARRLIEKVTVYDEKLLIEFKSG